MNTFVIGDIHGAYKALKQCLIRSNFNYENDLLITLGDICDGWSEVYECVEELLKIKNRIDIRGNHDEWFLTYIENGIHGSGWNQGAGATLESYSKREMLIPLSHSNFFKYQINYYVDDRNRCFVHGGFNRHLPINSQSEPRIYYWDRDLWLAALSFKSSKNSNESTFKFKIKDNFDSVFIGHTTTMNWDTDQPMKASCILNLDTGAGFAGKLTIINVDTFQYWQSDNVRSLYPDETGRN
jgi:serine/threonine protein phosphatase 1